MTEPEPDVDGDGIGDQCDDCAWPETKPLCTSDEDCFLAGGFVFHQVFVLMPEIWMRMASQMHATLTLMAMVWMTANCLLTSNSNQADSMWMAWGMIAITVHG